MENQFQITAEPRSNLGTAFARRLRHAGAQTATGHADNLPVEGCSHWRGVHHAG